MSEGPSYSLALSDQEVARYRFMAQMARADEAAGWERAGIVAGATVADIGCGPGLILCEMADVVGPTGRVDGVDRDETAVATATKLVAEGGVTNASVRQGDAWATGLPAGGFDVVNIRHVLAHNTAEHVRAILGHALDLLRPGGAIYLVDVDLTGGRLDPPDAVVQVLMDRYVDHLRDTGREPVIGPTLGSSVRAAGFDGVERSAIQFVVPAASLATIRPPAWAAHEAMVESGHASDAEVEAWDRALDQLQATSVERDRTMFMPMYVVIARKPA